MVDLSLPALRLKATFCCFLCDEKAHNEVVGSKGASGTKPCHCCQNVLGHIAPEAVPDTSPCVHYICTDPTKFKPHTADSLRQVMEELRSTKDTGSAGKLKELQQLHGFNFNENSLLMSDMAAMANLPDSTFWDWMRCIVASGGMGQYELNQFLRRIEKINNNWLSRIQDICHKVMTWPKASKVTKLTLKKRLRRKSSKSTKMFANELLQWVVVVGVFAEVELKPGGHLLEETACFELLVRILYLLRRGDAAVDKVQLLRTLVLEHHRRFLDLYPQCRKPKMHFTLHIPDCIDRFKINLSCFSPERLHKFTKHIAAFAYRNLTKCLLTRCLVDMEDKLCLPDTTAPFVLQPPALPVAREWLAALQAVKAAPSTDAAVKRQQGLDVLYGRLPEGFMEVPKCAQQLRCPAGHLHALDLLLWQSGGALQAGIATSFFAARGGKLFFRWCQPPRAQRWQQIWPHTGGNQISGRCEAALRCLPACRMRWECLRRGQQRHTRLI
jgi:hypothetical protein